MPPTSASIRPASSVNSIIPSGANAMSHGLSSPSTTTVTSRGGGGHRIAAQQATAIPATRIRAILFRPVTPAWLMPFPLLSHESPSALGRVDVLQFVAAVRLSGLRPDRGVYRGHFRVDASASTARLPSQLESGDGFVLTTQQSVLASGGDAMIIGAIHREPSSNGVIAEPWLGLRGDERDGCSKPASPLYQKKIDKVGPGVIC